jgi:alpha-glucosidase (family GH31 glycosyl hydrolase)
MRVGGVIPLAYMATNTKKQKWDRLVFDYYPDTVATDEGELYEDDGETTAYQYGQFRTSAYRAFYDKSKHAYCLKLSAAKGNFEGERACTARQITVKFHLLSPQQTIQAVSLNGQELPFTIAKCNPLLMPFSTFEQSADSDVLCVTFTASVEQDYAVCFFVA